MNNLKSVRWKQRFENFHNSFVFLEDSLKLKNYSALEISGAIKAFEMCYELAWNTLKDFLEAQGIDAKFPREVIKFSFKNGIIVDGHIWIEILDKRNKLTHTYDEKTARSSLNEIKTKYFLALKQVHDTLNELDKSLT